MDRVADVPEVRHSGRGPNFDNPVVEEGKWQVYQMPLDLDTAQWMWREMSKFRTLFSDFTVGDVESYYDLITSPNNFWLEVRDGHQRIGIMYLSELNRMIDTEVHVVFLDRKFNDKVALCHKTIGWLFGEFPVLRRMTATIPNIYHATIRLALKVGFKQEGIKRQSFLVGGQLRDECILGLTYEDYLNGK